MPGSQAKSTINTRLRIPSACCPTNSIFSKSISREAIRLLIDRVPDNNLQELDEAIIG